MGVVQLADCRDLVYNAGRAGIGQGQRCAGRGEIARVVCGPLASDENAIESVFIAEIHVHFVGCVVVVDRARKARQIVVRDVGVCRCG